MIKLTKEEQKLFKNYLLNTLEESSLSTNVEVRGLCPNPLHNSSHPNFFFNVEKLVGICHTKCGGFSLERLLACLNTDLETIIGHKIDIVDFSQFKESNNVVYQIEDNTKLLLKETLLSKINQKNKDKNIKYEKYDKNNYKLTFFAKNYLFKRGFFNPDLLYDKFDIGYEKYKGYDTITFHCLSGDKRLYTQRRNMNETGPRYLNDKGKKENFVWGLKYLDNKNYVILTEGPFNALTWLYLGYNAVALFGTNPTDKQLYRFKNMLKIVNFDLDKPGNKCYNIIRNYYNNRNIIEFLLPSRKDANQHLIEGKEELLVKLLERKMYGKISLF